MTCLLLENSLPQKIDGVRIYPDFRNMIRFERLLDDDRLSDTEKLVLGVRQLFEQLPPGGIARAADRLLWFYRRGQSPAPGEGAQGAAGQACDLTLDAGCIYAGFLQAYGIDLTAVSCLHWWTFLALLENLPEQTLMAQKMQLRTMDLSSIKDEKLRAHYRKLQRQAALPEKAAGRGLRMESTAERVKRRYAEAQRALDQKKDTATTSGIPETS